MPLYTVIRYEHGKPVSASRKYTRKKAAQLAAHAMNIGSPGRPYSVRSR